MKRAGGIAALLWMACAMAPLADAPVRSLHPLARPGQGAGIPLVAPAARGPAMMGEAAEGGMPQAGPTSAAGPVPPVPASRPGLAASVVPRARPAVAAPQPAAVVPLPQVALASTSSAAISPVPKARRGLFGFWQANAVRTQPDPGAIVGRAGSVCGVPGIKGKALPPIAARLKGCGLAEPVQVSSVAGIALTPEATVDCSAAEALHSWVRDAAKPAFSGKGGGLEALRVAASYVCRPRNNVPGARISEHGKGRAIDISGFLLKSGAEVTVVGDYRRGAFSRPLKAVHRAACGPFGTTLGPGSDGVHEDHIHMDTARYRSVTYCR